MASDRLSGSNGEKGAVPTMKIEVSDRNIPATLQEQALKVVEEYSEFTLVQVKDPDLDRLAEEGFDLIEALVRYMRKRGINIEEANKRHLEKMQRREEEAMSA